MFDFFICNYYYSGSRQFGSLFYSGNCVQIENDYLKVRVSSNWRYFHKYATNIESAKSDSRILSDDFYFSLDYSKRKNEMYLQSDIIAYEPCFIYSYGDIIAISNNILYLVCHLKNDNIKVEYDYSKVKEYLIFTENFFQDTFFKNIRKLPPATIETINIGYPRNFEDAVYDNFKFSGSHSTIEECAKNVYKSIDSYFKNHKQDNTVYTIGISGGLDSRIGGYFAKKNNYQIRPIFIGAKRNFLGIKTYDVVRAEAVNKMLGFEDICYFDPRILSLEEKAKLDSYFAPGIVDNISQNMDVIPDTNVLIHAMMGGEAFGDLVDKKIISMNSDELTNYLISKISGIPKYKISNSLFRYLIMSLPKTLQKKYLNDEKLYLKVLSENEYISLYNRVLNWVNEQKKQGFDNINIWQKWFYYRFAPIARNGYYSTFNGRVPSLATYINPTFINEMLCWKSEFLIDKKIQKSLIKLTGDLSQLRSQTIESSIKENENTKYFSKYKKYFYTCERIIRGGAMLYTDWFSRSSINQQLEKLQKQSIIWPNIEFDTNKWLGSDNHTVLTLIKLLYLEKIINENSNSNHFDMEGL